MAGSGGTPELVAAVSNAGALGSWAALIRRRSRSSMPPSTLRADGEAFRAQSVRRRLPGAASNRCGADAGTNRTRACKPRSCAAGSAADSAKPVRRSARGGDRSAARCVQLHLRYSKRRRARAFALRRIRIQAPLPRSRRAAGCEGRRVDLIVAQGERRRASRQLLGAVRTIHGADARTTRGLLGQVSVPVIALGRHHERARDCRNARSRRGSGATRHGVSASVRNAARLQLTRKRYGRAGDSTVITACLGPPGRGLRNKFIDMADIMPMRRSASRTIYAPMRNEAGKQGVPGYISVSGWAWRRARTPDAGGDGHDAIAEIGASALSWCA